MISALSNLMSLVQPKTASVEKHREEVARLSEVVMAARAEVERAQKDFYLEGTLSAEKALAKAQEAEDQAIRFRDRAKSNLADAEAAEEAERRAALEQRRAELESRLADPSAADKLAATEVRAWLAVVDAWIARREHEGHRASLRRELGGVCIKLGANPKAEFQSPFSDDEPTATPIVAALEGEARKSKDATRRDRLNHLARLLEQAR